MEEEAPTELGSFGFFTTLVWLDDELLELPGMAIVPTYPSGSKRMLASPHSSKLNDNLKSTWTTGCPVVHTYRYGAGEVEVHQRLSLGFIDGCGSPTWM